MANKNYSLAHTKWMCKYHIVFTPKYRRKAIYAQYRRDLQEYIKRLCKYKGVEILEGHMMIDHVHLLVAIPPRISVSSFMGYLKGDGRMTGEVFFAEFQAKCLCLFHGQAVVGCISGVKADDIPVSYTHLDVYKRQGQYYATKLTEVNSEGYYLTGWYDNFGCAAGKRVRVSVAVKKD